MSTHGDPEAFERTATMAPSQGGEPVEAETPSTIGRFVVERELGRGGMGVVYLAQDPLLGRPVAVKLLANQGGGTEGRARLLREAQALARLQHPNVVAVHDVGEHEGHVYLAMEYLAGETLKSWHKGRPAREVICAWIEAGRGLAEAHRVGLVHRDFKADNVFVDRDGRVRLLDFGLARAAGDSQVGLDSLISGPVSLDSELTVAGAIMGTPAYMAPEQIDSSEVGPAADQFAFCVSLWEALAGERPFPGQDLRTLRQSMEAGPKSTTETGWRRRVLDALARGLRVSPSERYPSLDACLNAIERAAGDDRFDLEVGRRQRRVLLAVIVALAGTMEALMLTGTFRPEATPGGLLPPALAAALGLTGAAWLGRRSLARNAINRRVAVVGLGMAWLMLVNRLIALRLGTSHAYVLAADLLLTGALAVGATSREARWLGLVAGIQLVGAVACALLPTAAPHIFTLDALATAALSAWFWER
ncbi:MAG: hypothetical protein AMXMBFR64_06990 [Myxococcales bacterium]